MDDTVTVSFKMKRGQVGLILWILRHAGGNLDTVTVRSAKGTVTGSAALAALEAKHGRP